jgi:pantoate kinase
VVGRKLLTKSVLSNPKKRHAINRQGSSRVEELLREPSFERLMDLSASFAIETGLATRRVLKAIDAASKLGMASMSMLGNSVFAVGATSELRKVLSDFGPTWVCKVDTLGPRMVRDGPC